MRIPVDREGLDLRAGIIRREGDLVDGSRAVETDGLDRVAVFSGRVKAGEHLNIILAIGTTGNLGAIDENGEPRLAVRGCRARLDDEAIPVRGSPVAGNHVVGRPARAAGMDEKVRRRRRRVLARCVNVRLAHPNGNLVASVDRAFRVFVGRSELDERIDVDLAHRRSRAVVLRAAINHRVGIEFKIVGIRRRTRLGIRLDDANHGRRLELGAGRVDPVAGSLRLGILIIRVPRVIVCFSREAVEVDGGDCLSRRGLYAEGNRRRRNQHCH